MVLGSTVLAGIRKGAIGAVTALIVGCLLVPGAWARQDSESGTNPTKSSATKSSATKTTPQKQHSTKSSSAANSKSSGKTTKASSKKRSSRKKSAKVKGQQKIDSERAQAIQEALIREHYLSGEATGTWNEASEEAMRRYQADHGWQSKTVPDSRALISLGLGPSKDHLLNPESAMTTVPDPPKSHSMPGTSTGTPSLPESVTPPSPTIDGAPRPSDASGPQ
ncbi:MAG: peptidoglycan-binding domain-containing protein [Candidatus Sulfotelmatobacter sp.]